MTRRAPPLLVAWALFCLSAPAASQSLDASVGGRVIDENAATLPGTVIVAIDTSTRIIRSAIADADGRYAILNLPAGAYDIRAELSGFAASRRTAQPLYVGTTLTVDFVLRVAVVADVEVRGDVLVLETTKSAITRVVQRDEIDALPLIDRNFNDLAALAPSVTRTGVYGGVDISGSRDFANAYQVDGVSAEQQRLGNQRIAFAQDWIQEFQVMTGQFNAEFGGAAGGVVNVITRSGSNRLAARAYGFFRDDAWDATPTFASRKPPLEEHRVGATVGGPVMKDRVFYFGGVEWLSNRSSGVVNSTFPAENGAFPSTDERTLSLIKLDALVTDRHRARFRYNGQRESTTGSSVGGTSTEEHGRFSKTRSNEFVGNWTWLASPTMVNEGRAAWSTAVPEGGCNFATRNPPGTWFERAYPGALFGCPVNFGTLAEDQFEVVENLSWARGAHELKAGADVFWTRSFGNFRNLRDGRYSFERDLPFSLADPRTHPFAFTKIDGPTAWNLWGTSGGLFVQDNWHVADTLTLNLGLRYDVDGSLTALNPLVRLDRGMHTFGKDLNNLAPRAGAAWCPFPGKRTVFRGGAGLFYDQNHNNVTAALLLNNILVDRIVAVNANSPQLNPFWPDIASAKSFLASALAMNTIPDLSALGDLVASTNDVDEQLQVPATRHVSVGVAHAIRSVSASADFIHARGFDLYVIRDVNLDPVTFHRLNPHYGAISSFGNAGTNSYKALLVQVNFVPSPRHLLKAAYTLATNRSNTSATLSTGIATNPFDYSEDVGPTDNDVRHTATIDGITTLPLGVRLSGIFTYRSALPYSATTNAPRPDGKPFGFRPELRNARRGDSAVSLDARAEKIVRLGARRAASAFVEVFNVTNATNYGDYIGVITSARFGEPTTAGPKRRMQLGFRVEF